MLGVAAWWLVIFGVVTLTVPTPESVKPLVAITFALGETGYLHLPSGAWWLMPIDRVTYYEYDRALLDDDRDARVQALARPGWVVVLHGQVVNVIDVDRAAVQVELLDSPNIGGRGWLKADQLRPYTGGS